MSIFSKRGQMTPPDDLDQGYDHGYYQQTDRRDDSRGDRRDDRFDDRRDTRYDERYDERYDRRDTRYDDRRDDRYDDRRDDRFDGRRDDDFVARPPRGGYDRRDSVYEEDDAPGYVERSREADYRRGDRAPAPARPQNKGTQYYTPVTCQDGREDMVCDLADSHVVAISLEELDGKHMVRLLDYVMGAVQVLGADIRRLEGNCIALIPAGVEIADEEIVFPEAEAYDDEDYDEDASEDELYDEVGEDA